MSTRGSGCFGKVNQVNQMAVEPEAIHGTVTVTTVTVRSEEGHSHGSHGDAALLCPQKIPSRENAQTKARRSCAVWEVTG